MDRAATIGNRVGGACAPAEPPLFAETTVHIFNGVAFAAFGVYYLDSWFHRSTLLEPIPPDLTVAAVGVGVFVGILLCAAMLSGWRQGMEVGGDPRKRWLRTAIMLVIALGGSPYLAAYCARRAVEFGAFHGLPVVTAPVQFTVLGPHRHRSRYWLELRDRDGDRTVELSVGRAMYAAAHPGDRLMLPVQTGRGGRHRLVPPDQRPDADALIRS